MKTLQTVFSSDSIQRPTTGAFIDVTYPNGTVITYDTEDLVVTDGYGKYLITFDETVHGYGLLSWRWGSLSADHYPSPQGGSIVVDAPQVNVTMTIVPTTGSVVEGLVLSLRATTDDRYLAGHAVPTGGVLTVALPPVSIDWEVEGRSQGKGTFVNNGTARTLAVTTARAATVASMADVYGVVAGIPAGDSTLVEITVYQPGKPVGDVLGFPDKERSAQFPAGSKFRIVTEAFGPEGEWYAKIPSGTIISVNKGAVTRFPSTVSVGNTVFLP